MPRTIRRISTLVYGLGIVGALAFGANEALGRPVYHTCSTHWPYIGACTNTGDTAQDRINCVNSCNAAGGGGTYDYSICEQPGNCCVCRS